MPTGLPTELVEVLSHYSLGQLVRQERDRRGTVNTAYFIEAVKDGERGRYFLRRYKSGVKREELLFEHSLIEHAALQATCPVARLHPTQTGQTFLHIPATEGGATGAFYAIFDFLPGEDRYTWVGPRLPRAETRNAGALLARFHAAASTLKPRGERGEPKIGELIEVIEALWTECPSRSKQTAFDRDEVEALRVTTEEPLAPAAQARDDRRGHGGRPGQVR